MMYSLNFGFWSSASFLSPDDDFTSGFTGSGGFSLLCGPFVQPCEKKVIVVGFTNNEQSGQYVYSKGDSRCLSDENNRQQRHDHGGLTVWIKRETKTYNNAEEI